MTKRVFLGPHRTLPSGRTIEVRRGGDENGRLIGFGIHFDGGGTVSKAFFPVDESIALRDCLSEAIEQVSGTADAARETKK